MFMYPVVMRKNNDIQISLTQNYECKYVFPCSYLDSAHALEKEGGSSLNKYEVCDNIDLPTILQVRPFCLISLNPSSYAMNL